MLKIPVRIRLLIEEWLPVGGIVVLGFTIRAAMGWARLGIVGADEISYAYAGRSLFNGHGLLLPNGTQMLAYHPLPAILIGLLDLITRDLDLASNILFALSGSLCAIPVYMLGRDLYSKTAGIIAAAVMATSPFFASAMMIEGWPDQSPVDFTNTEPIAAAFVLFGCRRIYIAYNSQRWRDYLLSGGLFGMAFLARPEGLLWMPVMAGWVFTANLAAKAKGKRLAVISAGLALAIFGTSVVMSPYIVWLKQNTGEFVLSPKAGSAILDTIGDWPEETMPIIEQWKLEHPGVELRNYSVPRFFLENPALLLVKIKRFAPEYLPTLHQAVETMPLILSIIHLIGLIVNRKGFVRESMLLFMIAPMASYLILQPYPRFLVYWLPVMAIWSGNVFCWIIRKRRVAGIALASMFGIWNVWMNAQVIYKASEMLPHEVYRIPGKWLKAKLMPGKLALVGNLTTGHFGGDYLFFPISKFDLDLVMNEEDDKDFVAFRLGNPVIRENLLRGGALPEVIGNKALRTVIEADGEQVAIYQRMPSDNRPFYRFMGRIPAIRSLPRIIKRNPSGDGGIIVVYNDKENFIPDELKYDPPSSDPASGDALSRYDSMFLKKRLEVENHQWEDASERMFNERAIAGLSPRNPFLVVTDRDSWLGKNGINSTFEVFSITAGVYERSLTNPLNDGRLVYYNKNNSRDGWINLMRTVIRSAEGQAIRDEFYAKYGPRGVEIIEIENKIEDLESVPQEQWTSEMKNEWIRLNVLRDEKLSMLQKDIEPLRVRMNEVALRIIASVQRYGQQNGLRLIYDIGGFSSSFDPRTQDVNIVLEMLDMD